ncbi:DUF1266 domain-containing protein [Neisseria sicca]|jgi:hypothetical protein|uniref:DUF1266 domain-containing protein n=1 Tax=Neisseria sicca TaxID=490 RepID=UPI000D2F6D0C|nr:DUF1266 domain-containing protein [Neisseria sicca]MBF1284619.1 DUF1266 domain-containing protein [Neisseria sp.]
MDITFVPYTLFAFTYRVSPIDLIFISEQYARSHFFSGIEDASQSSLAELAQALEEYYGVRNEKSALDAINGFDQNVYFCVLISALKRAKGNASNMPVEAFIVEFLDDHAVKTYFDQFGVEYTESDFNKQKAFLLRLTKYFFRKKDVSYFERFCTDAADFYALCEKQNMRGFDYARIVQIISNSFAVGYLKRQDYEKLIEFYGEKILKMFGSWEEYIASYILGGAYWDFKGIGTKTDLSERGASVYIAITSPYDAFAASGIWTDSWEQAKSRLCSLLEKYISLSDIKQNQENVALLLKDYEDESSKIGLTMADFTDMIDIYYTDFLNTFKSRRCEALLTKVNEVQSFISPVDTLEMSSSLFEETKKLLDAFKLKLEPGEWPILANTYSASSSFGMADALLTNRGIYLKKGVLFFKKLYRIDWKDTVLRVQCHYTGELRCYLNKKDYLAINLLDYTKLLHKKHTVDDDKNAITFRDEISAFGVAMNKLKDRFASQ